MSDDKNEPVHLVEDEETGDRFLVYGTDKGLRLDIRYEGETLWMTQAQIAQLFGVDRSVITKHIANVYAEGELDAEATSAKIAQVRQEGSRKVCGWCMWIRRNHHRTDNGSCWRSGWGRAGRRGRARSPRP